MEKLSLNDPESKSAELVNENIATLKAIFPDAFIEDKVDFEVLKQLLGAAVEESGEKYGFNWFGKRRARQIALTPSTGTLRPCPEESIDWNTTQNLIIEGDNLEVLKLLEKSYTGKVKLIYIDPPYNTGKDFVYADDFQDNIRNYKELTGQIEGGRSLSSNKEIGGRFHTNWLNMIYPRLIIARRLLSIDGVLIVSIGDEEISSMIAILREIFGEENHSANFVIIRAEGGGLAKQVVKGHDYLLVYAKDISHFQPLRRPREIRGEIVKVNGEEFWIEEDWLRKEFGKYGTCPYDEIEKYHGIEKKREIDKGLSTGIYKLLTKSNNVRTVGRLRKVEDDASKFHSVQKHLNAKSSEDFKAINMPEVFDFPKPVSLIREVVLGGSFFSKKESDIILDFFAGSGTTGHAVLAQNITDGGNRRYILVQLPEPFSSNNEKRKEASDFCKKIKKPPNIAELTKERLRRTSKKIQKENSDYKGDFGFRVFKLDTSNIRTWESNPDDLKEALLDNIDHIKSDRSEEDILYELLLKLGLDLCTSIEARTIVSKVVHAVGDGVLITCLEEEIASEEVESLALGIVEWQKQFKSTSNVTVVFRDSAFVDDVAKMNMVAILQQHGLKNIRSL